MEKLLEKFRTRYRRLMTEKSKIEGQISAYKSQLAEIEKEIKQLVGDRPIEEVIAELEAIVNRQAAEIEEQLSKAEELLERQAGSSTT